uniref:Bcl-2-associated transcription factor 1 n=2 Tax=Sciurus vulgaris TaxID=55149 RepID=A0A8D2CQ05_SCIVU
MGHSNSRSHSSRSKSRSQSSSRSRSRSHSRKKRYSSTSHSRTYSRSPSRDRIYSRDYRGDYRNNRGMRRPYGYRGRGRGYYQGGGGRYHRGGYSPVWNRRHSRSPRRGRSRSRSPKRRSVSSQRKKQTKKAEGEPQEESPLKSKSQEETKDTFEHDPSESIDDFNKSATSGDIWPGLSAYDNSPRSPHSPSPIATPPSQSSSCSDAPMLSTVHSAKNTPSQHSHSIQHSPERSGSGSVGNGSSRYSPSQNSPIHHIPSRRSPAKTITPQNAPRDESRGRSSFYPDGGDQETAKTGKFLKRFTDEESRVFLLDRGNTRDKEAPKEKGSEKGRAEGEWEDQEALDYFSDKESGKQKFNDSEGDDTEETEDYRQFRKSVLADQGKNFATASHRNTEEEGPKYKSKVSLKGNRESDGFREEKNYKLKETGYVVERPSTTKDKHKEEDKNSERITVKKETQSPEQVKSEKLKDLFDYSPPLHKNLDAREKSTFREESPLRIKMIASDSHHRLLASTLVHSVKKEQEFRSIFDHIKLPQASKSTSESFIQHIVSLVHHVKEQYFKSAAVTLNERFTSYQKATEEHSTRQKSPEIHRRIDISPSALRKHTRLAGEKRVFKEENQKGDKKLRCDSADLRHDIDRRRKERSKERGDSKGSRESSGWRKQEKTPKDYKEYKCYKDDSKHKSREQDHSRSSSSSASPSSPSSREEKESKKEREEEFKTHHEMKEYSGFAGVSRPRGTFFRIRGRGRARGVFAGTNTGPNNSNTTFQKRPKEEEWDPEYTPKSKKYFLHDDRDDGVDYWAKRGRGCGTFQRDRGRFNFKKSGSSPKWTHDKYQGDGIVEDEEESMENHEEQKERRKEEKEQCI